MASLQNFYTSRDNNANADSYVGQLDRLWYNPNLNSIYVSDGNTPGGIPVGLATAANAIFTNITVNGAVLGNLEITGNISAAANGKIGGITPGPGVSVSNVGLLTIDSANLPVSFGNFYANNNILSIVNTNEDMILSTQGNAEIQLIGNVGFYKPDGLPPNVANRYAFFNNDGQVTFYIPTADPFESAIQIIGSTTGNTITPGLPGAMLHITGQLDSPSRVYFDGNNDYVALVARRWNGNVSVPTQVLEGDDVLRINSTAATDAGVGNVAMAQIRTTALEDQTTTSQGSSITFTVTPVGSPASARVDVANITVDNGITSTKFTTTGNVSAGNLTLTGNIVANYIVANNVGSTGNVEIESNNTYWYFTTDNRFVGNGNISAGNVSVTGNVSAGNVISYVTLPAGTTTNAPLRFTAGNLLTPPAPGVMSYDGKFFYATPQGAERGLITTQQIYILNTDYALTNQTGVQSMYGVSASLSSNTRYAYVINAVVYKTANNITMSFAIDGNAVLSSHTYQTSTTASTTLATLSNPSVLKNSITSGFTTPVVVTAALNGTGYYSLQVTGVISVTTGGTWNPLIAFSGLPGAGSLVLGGSQVEIWPVGVANTTVSIGSWA